MQKGQELRVITKAALLIHKLIAGLEENQKEKRKKGQHGRFHSDCRIISSAYMYECLIVYIIEKAEVEESTLIIAMIILRNFMNRFKLSWRFNYNYYFITAIHIALKMNQDVIYDLDSFSEIVNVSSCIICSIESEILSILEWKVHVDFITYTEFCLFI